MSFHYIDMENFPRRAHFDYFSTLANPCVGLTVNVDITAFRREIKEKDYPFFLTLLYRAVYAANSVPEFRQRIKNGVIAEYDFCRASFTLALEDETYCYCQLDFDMPFEEFLPYALRREEECKAAPAIDDGDDPDELFFFSSIPWVSFTSVVQPMASPADSNPRIIFGKFFEQDGKTLLPVAVLTHHALTDGRHLSRFYEELQRLLDAE